MPVPVNVEDFVAIKTAMFGTTRLGKSILNAAPNCD
jgi:hypothetical protein